MRIREQIREWSYPQYLLAGLVAVVVVALIVAGLFSSASFGLYNQDWNGASDLRTIATDANADTTVVRNTSAYGRVEANTSVAVVLSPDTRYEPAAVRNLQRFLRRGGTLVVAGDYGAHVNPLLADLGVTARLDGRVVRDERYYYQSPVLPLATNVSNRSYTAGVEKLTLNHGTVVDPHNATVLARTSGYAYPDTNRNEELDANESMGSYPVVASERVGNGDVVVVSDPSIFVNTMLDRPGNRRFARRLVTDRSMLLVDYSHVSAIPPLALAVLVLRNSPLLQLIVGGIGIVGLLGISRAVANPERIRRVIGRDRPDTFAAATEAEIVAYVRNRHPDWDEDRVQRVTTELMARRERDT
jgi:hypothetical protein